MTGQFIEPNLIIEFKNKRLQKFIPNNEKYDDCDHCALKTASTEFCDPYCASGAIWRKSPHA
jgi:hypothetical protein